MPIGRVRQPRYFKTQNDAGPPEAHFGYQALEAFAVHG